MLSDTHTDLHSYLSLSYKRTENSYGRDSMGLANSPACARQSQLRLNPPWQMFL